MTEIDRRTLLATAGAGLVVAGCQPAKENEVFADGGGTGNGTATAGPCPHHGLSAYHTKKDPDNFKPTFVCAVYIKFDCGKPVVRHAYYKKALKTDIEVKPVAEYLFKVLRGNDITKYPNNVVNTQLNFHMLSMNSSAVMVIYVDNDPNEVRFNTKGGDDFVIRFSAESTNFLSPPPKIEENYAFYDLRKLPPLNNIDFPLTDVAYRIDYWDTDVNGNSWGVPKGAARDKWRVYSMNIHLEQKPAYPTAEVPFLPLILDPDTGNMGSDP